VKSSDLEANFYYALSHKIRRKIIKIIGEQGFSSFTYLKKELRVSTGTIYHHLENLAQLIKKGDDKKYYLTDLGFHAYKSLLSNIETMKSQNLGKKEFNSPLLKGLMFLTPKKFISFEKQNNLYTILISILILISGAILCGLNGLFPFLLFFIESSENISDLEPFFKFSLSLLFILNLLIYFIIIESICRLFYQKKENSLKFLISFCLIIFPIVIFLGIHFIFNLTDLIKNSFGAFLDKLLLIFFQVWSLWLLTYSLSKNKDLKFENGLIITLLLHYGSFTIILLILI